MEATGHLPTLHLEEPNQVRAELWTESIGKRIRATKEKETPFPFFKNLFVFSVNPT